MNELVPAILTAVADKRHDDFRILCETLIEKCDNHPVKAMAQLAIAANFLHRHPNITLEEFGKMNREVDD